MESSRPSKSYVACVVAVYFVTSITQVFVSKLLLSNNGAEAANAPFFISGVQATLTAAIIYALGQIGKMIPSNAVAEVPSVQFDSEIALKVMPLSVIFCSMIGFNQLCLQVSGHCGRPAPID